MRKKRCGSSILNFFSKFVVAQFINISVFFLLIFYWCSTTNPLLVEMFFCSSAIICLVNSNGFVVCLLSAKTNYGNKVVLFIKLVELKSRNHWIWPPRIMDYTIAHTLVWLLHIINKENCRFLLGFSYNIFFFYHSKFSTQRTCKIEAKDRKPSFA